MISNAKGNLTPFRGALYSAHAVSSLGSDGATILRYDPSEPPAAHA